MIKLNNEKESYDFGRRLGGLLTGGEVIEFIGDVGAGKTFITKAIARGMHIDDDIQSPTFTLSRVYDSPARVRLAHYDFYRLGEPGIMADELRETVDDSHTVTVIEWADTVSGVLPVDRLTITIALLDDDESRLLGLEAGGPVSERLVEALVA